RKSASLYQQANSFVATLQKEEDYSYDVKTKGVQLTEKGMDKAERYFGVENLFDLDHVSLTHHINQALKAHASMHRDTDYVVEEGDRKSTRLNSSHVSISYAVFCLKKKN